MDQIKTNSTYQFPSVKIKLKEPPDIPACKCLLCGNTTNDQNHALKCKSLSGLFIKQHDNNCKLIMKSVKSGNTVSYC